MNSSVLQKLKENISFNKDYISYLNLVTEEIKKASQSSSVIPTIYSKDTIFFFKKLGVEKRIFEYKAAVISLYGLFESYINNSIKHFLNTISSIVPTYNQIDEKIQFSHFENSLKLISNIISYPEDHRYLHLTKEHVLRTLNDSVVNTNVYAFNTDAFILSSGNLKHHKICDLFKLINIDLNEGLKKNFTLKEYLQLDQGLSNIDSLNTDTLYNKINDLVDRRNIIAHGSDKIDDLLDSSIILSYIDFIDKYCEAIFDIMSEKIWELESNYLFEKIEVIHGVWQHDIIGFTTQDNHLMKNDPVIIKTAENRYIKKSILEIQIDNQSYVEAFISEPLKVAIRVEPGVKINQFFYLKKNIY